MANELESLQIGTQFDPSGLAEALANTLQQIENWQRNVTALMRTGTVIEANTKPLEAALASSRAAIAETTALLSAAASSAEPLTAAFAATSGAIDQTTSQLRSVAGEAQAAITALDGIAAASQTATQSLAAVAQGGPSFGASLEQARVQTADLVQEVLTAAHTMQTDLSQAIASAGLDRQAAAAASSTVAAFQTGLLDRLADLRVELAQQLIVPAEFTKQADTALAAFSQETQAVIAAMPPIRINATIAPQSATPNMIPAAEMAAAEAAWAAMSATVTGSVQQVMTQTELLAGQLRSLDGVTINAADGAKRMAAGFAEASRQAQQAAAGTDAWTRGIANINGQQQNLANGFEVNGRGAFRLQRGLTALAVTATGVPGPMGQIASALLLIGAGSVAVSAAAAGIAIIGAAYHGLTAITRAAQEQNDKLVASLHQRVEATHTPTAQIPKEIDATQTAVAKNQEHINMLTGQLPGIVLPWVQLLARAFFLQGQQVKLAEHQKDLAAAISVFAQAQIAADEQALAAKEANLTFINQQSQATAALVAAGLPLGPQHQTIADRMGIELALARDLKTTDSARAGAIAAYNSLLTASLTLQERQGQHTAFNAQGQLDVLNRLVQRRAELDQPLSIQADTGAAVASVELLRKQLDANAAAALKVAKAVEGTSPQIAEQKRQEARAWQQLGIQIDDVLRKLAGQPLADAVAGVTRLVTAIQRSADTNITVTIPLRIDDTPAVRELAAQRTQLFAEAAKFSDQQLPVPTVLLDKLQEITHQIEDALGAPVAAVVRNAELIGQRLELLRGIADETAKATELETGRGPTLLQERDQLRALQPLTDALRARQAEITTILKSQSPTLAQQVALLQEQLQIAQQLAGVKPPEDFGIAQVSQLQQAADQFRAASAALQIAQQGGTRAQIEDAQQQLRAASEGFDGIRKSLVQMILGAHLDAATTVRLLKEIEDAYDRAGKKAGGLSDRSQAFVDNMAAVGQLTGFVDSVGRSFGGLDEDVQRVIDSTGQLAQSLAAVAANASFGNILGVIGAGVGLLGSIFGQSASSKEHDAIIKSNSDRLAELSAVMSQNIESVRGLADAQRAASAVFVGKNGKTADLDALARAMQQFGGNKAGLKFLDDQLAQFGLTFQQLNQIAKDNGITLLDSKGRVVAGSFDQLAAALRLTLQSMTQFNDTLDDQQKRLDLGARLHGEASDPAAVFARQLQAIEQFSPAIEKAFKGIDLSSEPAVRAALVDLFTKFDEKFFQAHPELFGGLTKDQFLAFLGQGADFLDSFNQGLNAATKSLLNVPQGFKIDLAEFIAQRPTTLPGRPDPRGIDFLPQFAAGAPGDTTSTAVSVAGDQVFTGDIFINVDAAGKNGGQLADEIKAQFQRESMAKFGTPDRWGNSNVSR